MKTFLFSLVLIFDLIARRAHWTDGPARDTARGRAGRRRRRRGRLPCARLAIWHSQATPVDAQLRVRRYGTDGALLSLRCEELVCCFDDFRILVQC